MKRKSTRKRKSNHEINFKKKHALNNSIWMVNFGFTTYTNEFSAHAKTTNTFHSTHLSVRWATGRVQVENISTETHVSLVGLAAAYRLPALSHSIHITTRSGWIWSEICGVASHCCVLPAHWECHIIQLSLLLVRIHSIRVRMKCTRRHLKSFFGEYTHTHKHVFKSLTTLPYEWAYFCFFLSIVTFKKNCSKISIFCKSFY